MGIAVFANTHSRPVWLAPLQGFWGLLMSGANHESSSAQTRPPAHAHAHLPAQTGASLSSAKTEPPHAARNRVKRPMCSPSRTGVRATAAAPPALPVSRLRVLREFEPGASPACAGRMVISGRMADVCAELDRMARRESALR
jgi:hypothetical protein